MAAQKNKQPAGPEITVAVLEDSKPLQTAIRLELEKPDIRICGMEEDVEKFLSVVRDFQPYVVIIDLRIWNDFDAGFLAVTKVKEISPDTKLIVHTAYDEPKYFHKAVQLGVKAFVVKKLNEIPLDNAVRIVANGGTYYGDMLEGYLNKVHEELPQTQRSKTHTLTDKELEVLRHLAEGLTIQEIREKLVVSLNTIKAHTNSIRRKLNVKTTSEAVRTARLENIIDNESDQ